MAEDREMGPITHMLHYKNALGSDEGKVENYIMNLLARQDANDPYFQEQAVFAALWLRDPQLFTARFTQYARLHPRDPMPFYFQQAAYLFGKQENRADLDRFPFDKNVKKTYDAFIKEVTKYNNQSAEIGRTTLYPFFGNTYYYEYYFLKYTK